MAHFAEIKNNEVKRVIVISNDDIDNLPFPESEPVGQAFIASLGIEGQWLQTSYNSSFRLNFAGIGWIYDASLGKYGSFIYPDLVEPVA